MMISVWHLWIKGATRWYHSWARILKVILTVCLIGPQLFNGISDYWPLHSLKLLFTSWRHLLKLWSKHALASSSYLVCVEGKAADFSSVLWDLGMSLPFYVRNLPFNFSVVFISCCGQCVRAPHVHCIKPFVIYLISLLKLKFVLWLYLINLFFSIVCSLGKMFK